MQAFINTGDSIVVDTVVEENCTIYLDCRAHLETKSTTQIFADEADKYYCSHALAMGFDSIQFHEYVPPSRTVPSILFCSGGCAAEPVKTSCVPLETRTGINLSCSCDPSLPVINCGTAVATNESCIQKNTIPGMND